MTLWEFAGDVLIAFVIADQIFGFTKKDEEEMDESQDEIEYTQELYERKISDLSREMLLQLIARQMEEGDEVADIDQDLYFQEQFYGNIGYANMTRQQLLSAYAEKVGADDEDADFEDILSNVESDIEFVTEHPNYYSKWALAPTNADRQFLQEFVELSEHLANESIFYPVEFAKLAVRVREYLNS